ncbi:MAG: patatin-like phospholipase family protein, partial [Gammaproteobacteria bacterium]|nr:patatin-like phospholipase family protein [Gammaproteobacteria bacterium]
MEQHQFEGEHYQEAFLLLKNKVFVHLSNEQLYSLIQQSDRLHLRTGEILFSEGDTPDYVYVVLYGRLSAHLSIAHSSEQAPSGFFPRGALVGEVGAITNSPRTMAVMAHRDTQLLRVPATVFEKFYSTVIAENLKQMQDLYLMQLNRDKKLFRRMRKESSYTFKTLIPLQENVDIEPIISAIEALDKDEKQLYILRAEILHSMSSQNDRMNYLEKLESVYPSILIVMSPDSMNFIESILDVSDKVILIANEDTRPTDSPFFNQLIVKQNQYAHTIRDLILIQSNRNTRRCGQQWVALKPSLIVRYYFREDGDSLARLYRYFSGQQIGLVLGGAGYRGMAYIGILKALRDYHIPIDIIGGVSIGAAIGAAFVVAKDMAEFDFFMEALEVATRRMFSWKELSWLPTYSIFTGHSTMVVDRLLAHQYIENMPIPFFCVSCNLSDSKEMHHFRGHLATLLRASSALPGLLPPVAVEGHLLVDGGVTNNLPVDVMRSCVDYSGIIISADLSGSGKMAGDYTTVNEYGIAKMLHTLFSKKSSGPNLRKI